MSCSIKVTSASLLVPNYVQADRKRRGLAAMLFSAALARPKREYKAILKDIDFVAQEGDRIALLGRNGAGKTSLLRLLSGAFLPTTGVVEVNGTAQSLLSLGLGFLSEATVRENIVLRSAAMGLRASQVLPNIDSILDFAGLTDAASNRMVTLSSGQRMRLGFAVSTSVQHDIMLLDEWFGAGDAEFVDKARERMSGRVQGSKIVILASHNLKMLRQVCNRGLVIEDGRIVYAGGLEESIEAYKATYQTSAEYQQYKREKQAAENESLAARLEQRVWRRQVRNQRKQILAQWEKIRAEKEKIMKQKEYLAKRELVIEKKMSEMRDDKG